MKKLLLTLPALLILAQIGQAQCVPVFTDCPTNVTTVPDLGMCTAVVNYSTPLFSGCVSGTLEQTAGLPSGGAFPIGTTTNTFAVKETIFAEDFSDNTAGWTLGIEWAIGPTIASGCGSYGNQDPDTDHSTSGDNGVAGMNIGGCTTTALHGFYYITSPVMNTAGMTNLTFEYWRWLNSDYTPYMQNRVEVYDGTTWQIVWQSGSSPGVQDASWALQSFNISAYANANMQIRFGQTVGSGGAFTVSGWNVDDVSIHVLHTSSICSFDVEVVGETSVMTDAVCVGDTYTFGTQSLTVAGTYVETFSNMIGCDSVVTLTLSETALFNEVAADAVCTGDTYVFGTQSLTMAGIYVEVFTSVLTGCDSTVTLTLTENAPFNEVATDAVCTGDTYIFGTQSLTVAGIYVEVFTSALNGCDSTVTLTLTENTPPSITVTSTTDEILGNDGAIDITITGGSTYTYVWSNAASSEDLTGIASGTYDVTVTDDATGCTATETIVVGSQVGIDENYSSIVTLYPNPTNGMITLTFTKELNDVFVVITNVLGEEVYSENVSGTQKHELNLDKSTGVYFVNVYDQGNLIKVMKVVKQ